MQAQAVYAVGYGCVLDSGTTFAYLPSAAFTAFATMIKTAAAAAGLVSRPGADPQVGWHGSHELRGLWSMVYGRRRVVGS